MKTQTAIDNIHDERPKSPLLRADPCCGGSLVTEPPFSAACIKCPGAWRWFILAHDRELDRGFESSRKKAIAACSAAYHHIRAKKKNRIK